jgi:3-isopropylmalate/(R)-2-methylmalate dehydratase large subunit
VPTRMTICNLAIDAGVKSAVMEPNAACMDYLRARGITDVEPVRSDRDARFVEQARLDLDTLVPHVAVPPSPTDVRSLAELEQTRISHAYIGSCASGTLEDLRLAARILRQRKVHPGVELLVIPATQTMYREAMREGLLETFLDAGAQVSSPTCGPCFGGLAQLGPGDVRISTSTRNDPGRMGSTEASIYLASAATVAASAVAGAIADPRDFIGGTG